MVLREAIQQVKGFRYMVEQLPVCSAVGRRCLYDLPWTDSKEVLETAFDRVRKVYGLLGRSEYEPLIGSLEGKLMQLRDIRGTVKRTDTQGVADDLELFELKYFALLSEEIRKIVRDWQWVKLPDLEPVVRLLDPEGQRVPHFYIYDGYSPELATLRAEIKQRTREGAGEEELETLHFRSRILEDRVREELAARLRPFHQELEQALEGIGLLDVVLAKAKQAYTWKLTCPEVREEGDLVLEGLFHPQVQEALKREGKSFQAVDLRLGHQATVITGANMAGKTVLLKSVQLVQYLAQFGFYVPARKAVLPLVERVLTSIGDEQDELNGLSSFAAEMLRVNAMVRQVAARDKILVLIDELARTTNPLEGRAIVNGVVDFLSARRVMAVITTHYGGITAPCRKLRVKGFVEDRVEGEMTLKNIDEYIDYSLQEDNGEEVPREAMRIAGMLGVDPGLLKRVENFCGKKSPSGKRQYSRKNIYGK